MTNEEIAVALAEFKKEIGSLKHRMKNCEEWREVLNEMAGSVNRLAINMEYMAKEQTEQGQRLARLEQEPADTAKYYKRQLITSILTGVIGIIIGALFSLIIKQ